MIPTDYPVALAAGSVGALLQIRFIRLKKPSLLSGRVVKVGTYASLFYGLAVGYFVFKYPGWMYGYVADPEKLQPWFAYLLFVPTMGITGYGAAMITQALIEGGKTRKAMAFGLLSLALCALSIIAVNDAFTHIGTFAEWCAGTAPKMSDQTPRMETFRSEYNLFGLILGIPGVALVAYLVREAVQLGKPAS